jgi:hypothetical protein
MGLCELLRFPVHRYIGRCRKLIFPFPGLSKNMQSVVKSFLWKSNIQDLGDVVNGDNSLFSAQLFLE